MDADTLAKHLQKFIGNDAKLKMAPSREAAYYVVSGIRAEENDVLIISLRKNGSQEPKAEEQLEFRFVPDDETLAPAFRDGVSLTDKSGNVLTLTKGKPEGEAKNSAKEV